MSRKVTGLVCAVCGTAASLTEFGNWVCSQATPTDRHHVLTFTTDASPTVRSHDSNPFLAFREQLAVDAFGAAIGLSVQQRVDIISTLDQQVQEVAGVGFLFTPVSRAEKLSQVLGFSDVGGVWIKDETHNVARSHKARHLFTELVYLVMAEQAGITWWSQKKDRPALAIASCGNAAIAASTLALAVQWPIAVHVPVGVSPSILATLTHLEADVHPCPRLDADPLGDPCVVRARERVSAGAIPFGVQGTENVWCLDGGRTLGWEIAEQVPSMDRIFVQVGGGAMASSIANGIHEYAVTSRFHAVQSQGCAPLVRAWETWSSHPPTGRLGEMWSMYMRPWDRVPVSLADGILDDETYDWIDIISAASRTGGSAVMASEANVVEAHRLAHEHTEIDVSPTGSAGLAGVLEHRQQISHDEKVLVIFSGRTQG